MKTFAQTHQLFSKSMLLCLFLSLSLATSWAQTNEKTEEKPYIEVTGWAEKEIVPNEIYVSIKIEERYANKVKITVAEQEDKLKSALKWLNIDLANLSLSDADANYVRIPWRKKEVITSQFYTLKLTDAETLKKVFQEMEKLELKNAYISKVDHSQIDSLQKEVRIEAMKKAKEKADYMLKAIGEQTGKPLIVRDNSSSNLYASGGIDMKGSRASETEYFIDGIKIRGENDLNKDEIQFRKIKVSSNVYVKFSIK